VERFANLPMINFTVANRYVTAPSNALGGENGRSGSDEAGLQVYIRDKPFVVSGLALERSRGDK
jgi:hypothetical protein